MTLETIFITQIASVIGFIIALFVLYRILVSTKDATIENLKQQISLGEQKIKDLSEQEPDVLLQRYQRRMEALEKELGNIELEATKGSIVNVVATEKVEKIEAELEEYERSFEKGIAITRQRQLSIRSRMHLMQIYDGSCQICGMKNSSIMQICHIKPFHAGGESSIENMLLLCPNDHSLFDRGLVGVNGDYTLIGREGVLITRKEHVVSKESLEWHRKNVLTIDVVQP